MRTMTLALAAAALAVGLAGPSPPAGGQGAATVTGLWLDDEGKAGVDIQPCGAEMCGRIVWLKEPMGPDGKPWTDKLNPDAAKRSRPVCGLQVMGGLKRGANGTWQDGWVYDPEEGKSYNLEITLKDAATLSVVGYVGIRLLSETFQWRRLPAGHPRCAGA